MNAMVKVLPAPEKADKIRELLSYGWAEDDIIEKVFGPSSGADRAQHTTAVRGAKADPHAYDTYIDLVAVSRALEGDRAVWQGLTHYERREVMLCIVARRQAEFLENAEEEKLVRTIHGSKVLGNLKRPHDRQPQWVRLLADAFGFDGVRLLMVANEYAQARVL